MRALIAGVLVLCALATAVPAQDLSALARFRPEASEVTARGGGAEIVLALSQPVPWRVRLLDNPARLVLDMREVDWTGIDRMALDAPAVTGLRAGMFRAGWSRLVMQLGGPYLVAAAAMDTSGAGAVVRLRLEPASAEAFAAQAARPEPPEWSLPAEGLAAAPPAQGAGPLVVVIDPGHGGIDPGAERHDTTEAHLMLTFARELKEALRRAGGFRVVMTRDEDVFVPLETRISIAHDAEAGVFISLHADALAEGEAVGATIYTLSDEASDAAAVALAERHDRDDLLAGVDLTQQDDQVAQVLMDIARTETWPRTDALADALMTAIQDEGITMHRIPRQSASFSVLKSPDIPSVLLETGFLSSDHDFSNLINPAWRQRLIGALVRGLRAWVTEDAAQAGLRRQ